MNVSIKKNYEKEIFRGYTIKVIPENEEERQWLENDFTYHTELFLDTNNHLQILL